MHCYTSAHNMHASGVLLKVDTNAEKVGLCTQQKALADLMHHLDSLRLHRLWQHDHFLPAMPE